MTTTIAPTSKSPSSTTPRPSLGRATPAWLKKIAVITTSRADSGIYRPLLTALSAQPQRHTLCLVGGNHHSELFGTTAGSVPRSPRLEIIPVEHFIPGDRPEDVAGTAGQAMIEFSSALARNTPDLVFVLGDRTEMLAAALAALIHNTPIAHLHGGDTTLGAYDEQCRHALTKLAHLHFPALPEHARKIEAMGEEPWRIHAVGSLALDALHNFQPQPVADISARVGVDLSKPTIVVLFHPETLSTEAPEQQIAALLSALEPLNLNLLLIGSNADAGHAAFQANMRDFATAHLNRVFLPSLTQEDFWGCLAHAAALVGNSSAGIIEATSFRLPVVNIGMRQAGRVRPRNVMDAEANTAAITEAIRQALSPEFRPSLTGLTNPYGDGHAAERILAALASLPSRATLLRKK